MDFPRAPRCFLACPILSKNALYRDKPRKADAKVRSLTQSCKYFGKFFPYLAQKPHVFDINQARSALRMQVRHEQPAKFIIKSYKTVRIKNGNNNMENTETTAERHAGKHILIYTAKQYKNAKGRVPQCETRPFATQSTAFCTTRHDLLRHHTQSIGIQQITIHPAELSETMPYYNLVRTTYKPVTIAKYRRTGERYSTKTG